MIILLLEYWSFVFIKLYKVYSTFLHFSDLDPTKIDTSDYTYIRSVCYWIDWRKISKIIISHHKIFRDERMVENKRYFSCKQYIKISSLDSSYGYYQIWATDKHGIFLCTGEKKEKLLVQMGRVVILWREQSED